jgi:hypothetical protein
MDTQDIPVENTTKSLSVHRPNSVQRSERVVAVASSILTGEPSYENCEAVTVLMSILSGITENTLSSDIYYLSVARAQQICRGLGVSDEVFEEVTKKYLQFAARRKLANPMNCLFE